MSETETTQATESQEVAAPAEAAPVSFIETLPEDIRMEPSLRNFTDAAGLAKSYVQAQRMIGVDKIPIPGQSATDEEWNNVYERLGRPNAPDQYDFNAVDGFEEGDLASFKQIAHDTGLNGKQAQRMAKSLAEKASAEIEAREAQATTLIGETKAELEREYGKALDQKMKMAKNAAVQLLGSTEPLDNIVLEDGRLLGDHPAIVKLFVQLADAMGEDSLEGEPQELIMTPQEANRKIMELMAKDTPYWDKSHPQHDFYVKEALALREHM